MILGHAGRTLNVAERYGFVSDDELVNAIDKFTYEHGLTQFCSRQRPEIGKLERCPDTFFDYLLINEQVC